MLKAPRVIFVAAVEEGRACLEALLDAGHHPAAIVTLPDRLIAQTSGGVTFDDVATRQAIPLVKLPDLKTPDQVRELAALEPELLIVVGWTRLLGPEALRIPRLGAVGFHASLLPRYRGRAPVNWAIINGERSTGNTMLFLDEGVDTGDIVDQRAISIEDDDTCATLYRKVAEAGTDMLLQHMPDLMAGTAPRRVQDHGSATLMPARRPEDGLIDWSRSTRQLYDWVRALTHPYPGAFTYFGSHRVDIWRARTLAVSPNEPEGTVGTVDGGLIAVATSDGWLIPEAVGVDGQPERGNDALRPFVSMRLGTRP